MKVCGKKQANFKSQAHCLEKTFYKVTASTAVFMGPFNLWVAGSQNLSASNDLTSWPKQETGTLQKQLWQGSI